MTNKNLFKQFPEKSEFFQTSDGSVFFNKTDAKNWAKELKDGVVNVITKNDSEETKEAKKGVKSDGTPNKEELMAYYNSLTGKTLPKNIGLAKLQERIAEAEEMVKNSEADKLTNDSENEDLTNENEENNETKD